jgi:hypothetical protein
LRSQSKRRKNILYPDLYVDSLLDIPLDQLKDNNIKAFILDLDNTITEWNSNYIREEVGAWFSAIISQGFKACILSNNGQERVVRVAESLGIALSQQGFDYLRCGNLQGTGTDCEKPYHGSCCHGNSQDQPFAVNKSAIGFYWNRTFIRHDQSPRIT